MNSKQRRTLEAIFEEPTRRDIEWVAVEGLLNALGAEISEGRGSRVRVALNDIRAVFHRPHPQKEAKHYQVKNVRDFLRAAGVEP